RSPIRRSNYTPRNEKGLEGVIELQLNVVSDYLHVGSGKYDVEVMRSVSDVKRLVEDYLSGGNKRIPNNVDQYFSMVAFLMVRNKDNVVIPGSTIKGMVRSRLELSVPGSCYIVTGHSTSSSAVYKRIFNPDPNRGSDRFDVNKFPQVCPVCDLLGNMGLASRVSLSDFVMTSGKVDYVNVKGRDYEVVTKGSIFAGKVLYKSLKPVEIGMLLYGFGFVKDCNGSKVMLLGRFKFSDKRFGRVKFSLKTPIADCNKLVSDFVKQFNPRYINEE
nr:Chain J, CRISPR-associated Cas7 paralog (Type III-D) [Saccharolobus solfataricus]